ncbi:hypothetical protein NX059_012016 [Plenodomus lindquistii]|nr:hypothetical protein NX059_012016 [Plenodomus lindquistii]
MSDSSHDEHGRQSPDPRTGPHPTHLPIATDSPQTMADFPGTLICSLQSPPKTPPRTTQPSSSPQAHHPTPASSSDATSGLISPPRTPPKPKTTPYVCGHSYTARRHEPAQPCGEYYWESADPIPAEHSDISQLDWCLSHPRSASGRFTSETRQIDIEQPIRVGDNCGAQIVLLRDGLVAKIYDPLYYKFIIDEDPNISSDDDVLQKHDVVACADTDYAAEVAAYEELSKTPLAGTTTPKYYGSWDISLPVETHDGYSERHVRMILIEHIPGISMQRVKPSDLTANQREQIMFKVIEADVDLEYVGVHHDDFEPRNIMLSTSGPSALSDGAIPPIDSFLRVCVIDLARSTVFRLAQVPATPRQRQNPIFSWVGQDFWSDWGWLPYAMEDREWMWRMWGDGGKDGKYVPVERDPESEICYPIRPSIPC